MKDSEIAFFRSQRRSFFIAFIINNLYLANGLFSFLR